MTLTELILEKVKYFPSCTHITVYDIGGRSTAALAKAVSAAVKHKVVVETKTPGLFTPPGAFSIK